MTRLNKVLKYIEKEVVNKTIRDVSDIEELINEEIIENVLKLQNDNSSHKDKYIRYMTILKIESSAISIIYIYIKYIKTQIKYHILLSDFFIIKIYVLFLIILIVLIEKEIF